jgi:hypothetical protein
MLSKKHNEKDDEENRLKKKRKKKLDPYDRSKVRDLDRKQKDDDYNGSPDYRY